MRDWKGVFGTVRGAEGAEKERDEWKGRRRDAAEFSTDASGSGASKDSRSVSVYSAISSDLLDSTIS